MVAEFYQLLEIQYLYACGILFLLSSVSIIILSLATAPPAKDVSEFVWTPALWHKERQELQGKLWYQNYRMLSVCLAAITLTIIAFWW
jgi:hypothetical protein